MQTNKATGFVQQATMQDFNWPFKYSGIFMIWCVGYLARPELVAFLQKAKDHLMESETRRTRRSTPESFIILLDNVLDKDDQQMMIKDQRVRTKTELESIFDEAGLIVFKQSDLEPMPGDHVDIMAWALY